MVKNPPVVLEMQEMWVPPLGWEDPLEKGMATHFGILGWRIPQTRGAWLAIFHGVANSRTQLSTPVRMHTHMRARTHTHTHRVRLRSPSFKFLEQVVCSLIVVTVNFFK